MTKDGIAEGSEMFDLTFTIPSTVKAVILGTITRAIGSIVDIESKYSRYYLLLDNSLLSDITVSFIQATYTINENNGLVQPVLSLSIPSSTVINVSVNDVSNTATGK